MKYAIGFLLGFVMTGCTGTGQPEVSFSAYYVPPDKKSFVVDDIDIEIVEARVAFGPAYFCASESGSATLCETARGEILDESVFDAMSNEPQNVGTYHGFVGKIQSGSYDQGIHWYLPQDDVELATNAPLGHSALIRGTATRLAQKTDFEMLIDIVPQYQGQRGVQTVSVPGDITESTKSLEMRFDLESWISVIDYAQMLDSGVNPYVIEKGSVEHDAVVIKMVSTNPVGFVFVK